jgi:hypothetical protein
VSVTVFDFPLASLAAIAALALKRKPLGRFRQLIVTVETISRPATPGPAVLQARLRLS